MDRQDILKTIQTVCSETVGIDPKEITPHADLRDDLGLSLPDIANILTNLQAPFHLVIPKEQVKSLLVDMVTVEDIITFVEDELVMS
ncbi:MAG TPA: hypothetical protein DCX25_00510 [Candidatus Pacebacteria bacterium]|nr:MAG: Acyl carrier protein [Microgenomates group bacterium GW2011_GWB1_45_17]KKU24108.1 MAG: Acyl carrier protein [Microgenomates group bacterium GW2011_GWC1_46_15]KKU24822.1 MAG: Acyl carrier protein [Microgenomates group bacterium GW2011_GWA1_46_15]HAV14803.1 hypothetical protein [Candidatus Paceibacterota bacterium]HCR11194.1 hypothetical protein [Candidatus Paceibacterota bacterium]